ncbi:MAG: hypothetical protein ACTJHU_04080 [Mycetocola sp.]
MTVDVRPVDERDTSWEIHAPLYRLFVFEGEGHAVGAYDLTGCTVREALDCGVAMTEGDRHLWSLAQVIDEQRSGAVLPGAVVTQRQRGLVWLSGTDYNDGEPSSPAEWRLRAEMQDRYLLARSLANEPVVLPEGLRVIRMVPGWTMMPLWENFTDNSPFTEDSAPVSAELRRELISWSQEWERGSLVEVNTDEGAVDGGDAEIAPVLSGRTDGGQVGSSGTVGPRHTAAEWAAWGARLYHRAVAELDGVAEVRPEFDLPGDLRTHGDWDEGAVARWGN